MRKVLSAVFGPLLASCPMGGEHSPGTSGEWIGRCTKCGMSC